MKYNGVVREVSKEQAIEMVVKYHYSDTLPKINKHFLGYFVNDRLVGVVTLGYGTRPRHTIQLLFHELSTSDYYEIGRMCMTEDMPRNSESQMLSAVVKWIRKNEPQIKVLFTWADGILGKPGYVYQACSFVYAGYVESEIYLQAGIKLHPRKMRSLLSPGDKRRTVRPTLRQMRSLGIDHYKGRQFRYFKLLCGKKEKKHLMDEAKSFVESSYPKSDALMWRKRNLETGQWECCDMPHVDADNSRVIRTDGQLSLF